MSKFQLRCSCVNCHTETTIQSLKNHLLKCSRSFKHLCTTCGKGTNNLKYCSHSCRARDVNPRRTKQNPKKITKFEHTLQRFELGLVCERPTIRKCLTYLRGYACTNCNISNWDGKPITLIVDHINGNAGDNTPTNLRLLCPNCNSQTPTFGGRNKGNGRRTRGLPLH